MGPNPRENIPRWTVSMSGSTIVAAPTAVLASSPIIRTLGIHEDDCRSDIAEESSVRVEPWKKSESANYAIKTIILWMFVVKFTSSIAKIMTECRDGCIMTQIRFEYNRDLARVPSGPSNCFHDTALGNRWKG
jgi:hypothetical protein